MKKNFAVNKIYVTFAPNLHTSRANNFLDKFYLTDIRQCLLWW